jgi:CRISPR-associated protein Csc2
MLKNKILPYLGNLDNMTNRAYEDKEYIIPALKNLGSLSIVLLRETIAPVVFKNQDAEITRILIENNEINKDVVRATPNKMKYKERQNGLKLLRHFNAGGIHPQNRTFIQEKEKPSSGFDINSFVFGDSTNHGNRILAVKSAVLYSDALSMTEYGESVDKTFHNRAFEDGSLFNALSKKNSSNLFERHYVIPGIPLIQVITINNKLLPIELFDHLLLSIGEAGSYGGQTSVLGTNIKTHIVGIYGSLLEKSITSPYEIASLINSKNINEIKTVLHEKLSNEFNDETIISSDEVKDYRDNLFHKLQTNSQELSDNYLKAKEKVGELFDLWFSNTKA